MNVRHRLAALSSLFEYLYEKNAVTRNPVKGVKPPPVESNEGKTQALRDRRARALLDAPDSVSLKGMRDGTMLATLLYQALRRDDLCKVSVKDFRRERCGVRASGNSHAAATMAIGTGIALPLSANGRRQYQGRGAAGSPRGADRLTRRSRTPQITRVGCCLKAPARLARPRGVCCDGPSRSSRPVPDPPGPSCPARESGLARCSGPIAGRNCGQ